jgi:hypothetical protein
MDSNSLLELKVSSCKDLRAFNFFQKLSAYALVSIVSDDPNKKLERNQQQRTPADGEGDGNPEWNQEMRFDLNEISFEDCDHLFLHFDLQHQGVMFGDKSIGEVRVGLKDLILTQESNLGAVPVRFVSYQVRASDGKPNGVLSFSYKVSGKIRTTTTSSHEIHYPTLELVQNLSEEQVPLSAPQYLQEYPSHQTYYYPPAAADAYYPPPPPRTTAPSLVSPTAWGVLQPSSSTSLPMGTRGVRIWRPRPRPRPRPRAPAAAYLMVESRGQMALELEGISVRLLSGMAGGGEL